MVRRVNLSENDHAVSMLHNLKDMKHEEDLCDFTIRVKNDVIEVHRCVISAGSPYFKAMFRHDTKEKREGKVDLQDVDVECVKSCLEFMYSGYFDIPDGKIRQLLHVATMMQLDKVTDAIRIILDEDLNLKNFHETRSIAAMYNLQSLSKTCKEYYRENFMAIFSQPGFRNENESHIIDILSSKSFRLDEQDKLTISITWVGENLDRMESLVKFIKLISLKNVPANYLRDLLENHPLISTQLQLYELINAPLVTGSKERFVVLFDDTNDCLKSFDPTTNDITEFRNIKHRHLEGVTAVSLGSYIYVLGNGIFVYRLNLSDKILKWERMQDMIVFHGDFPPSVCLFGEIFVIGSTLDATNDVEKFDSVSNQWLKLKDKPDRISCPSLVSLNESVYCIGGTADDEGGVLLNSFVRFTPSTSEWVNLTPLPDKPDKAYPAGLVAVAVKQKIYIFTFGRECFTECYNITSGQWTSLSPLEGDIPYCLSHYINNCLYLIPFIPTKLYFIYDIANNKWSEVKREDEFILGPSVTIQI